MITYVCMYAATAELMMEIHPFVEILLYKIYGRIDMTNIKE